jgi:glycine/D-amino acid oxidase-like deaminating enzyme
MKKIAVIGAGVFGCEVSIQLSQKGFHVTLIEKNDEILQGATSKSVLRLHLGFHYPRDLETAIQSRRGYGSFLNRFPAAVDLNFENYYGLAKRDSRINQTQFLDFVKLAGISMSEVPKDKLAELGFETTQVQAIYSNDEGVISIFKLRKQFLKEMKEHGVQRVFNSEVVSARQVSGMWVLSDTNAIEDEFDFVVRATYGHDRIIISGEQESPSRIYEFHRTLVLETDLRIPRIGMTVIDGDFLTVLPKAGENSHLLYAPVPSVMDRFVGNAYPTAWNQSASELISKGESDLLSRYRKWFTKADPIIIKERLVTVRAIDSQVKETDRRISQINLRAEKFIDINSGKIDHCVGIAEEVASIITKSL